MVRTTVAEAALDQTATVTAYKQLSTAERAFRSLKTVDLEVRPIYHCRADRVRAHVFLCMLAYYVNGEMFRWCLQNDLRLVHQMTLMTIGLYNDPAGAYLPSVLY